MTTAYKVGIFGDSYSYDGSLSFDQKVDISHIGPSWVNLIKNDFEVTNFSFPGTSLYYSYHHFLENYNKFDKIIFVFTLPGRISVKHPVNKKFMHLSYWHGIDLKEIQYPEDKKLYRIISDYIKYVQDEEKENILYNLMKKDILEKCPNLIAMNTSDLMTITAKENQSWNITFEEQLKFNDIRNCHLTKENNNVLYNAVKRSIFNNTDVKINLEEFVQTNDKEMYLLKHDTKTSKIIRKWSIKG